MTVYWDLFLFVHAVTDSVMMWLVSRITHRKTKKYRFLLGVAVCVGLSFCFSLPVLPTGAGIAVGVLTAFLSVGVGYGFTPIRAFLKTVAVFFCVETGYVGVLMLCTRFFSQISDLFVFRNGVVYYNFPIPYLFGATGVLSLAVIVTETFFRRRIPEKLITPCRITLGRKEVTLNCLTDTGNRIRDPLSGLPVAVVDRKKLGNLVAFSESGGLICDPDSPLYTRFRLITFHGAGGTEGVLQAFRPDSFSVSDRKVNVLVAIDPAGSCAGTEYDGILPVLTEGEN